MTMTRRRRLRDVKDINDPSDPRIWGFKDPVKHSWEDLTAATKALKVKPSHAGNKNYVLEMKIDGSYNRLSSGARAALDSLLATSLSDFRPKLTKQDVKEFCRWKKQAEEEVKFYLHYFKTKVIQHDSTVDDVIRDIQAKGFKLPRVLVSSIINDSISWAKILHRRDLDNQFALFLTDCDFITVSSDLDPSCLDRLKKDPRFKEKNFGELDDADIYGQLSHYMDILAISDSGETAAKLDYKQEISEALYKNAVEEERAKMIPCRISTAVHYLVYKSMVEGYKIQHPVFEIIKILVYFGGMIGSSRKFREITCPKVVVPSNDSSGQISPSKDSSVKIDGPSKKPSSRRGGKRKRNL